MADPDERESREGWILEQCLYLHEVPGFRSRSRLSLGQRLDNRALLFFSQELCVGIRKIRDPEE